MFISFSGLSSAAVRFNEARLGIGFPSFLTSNPHLSTRKVRHCPVLCFERNAFSLALREETTPQPHACICLVFAAFGLPLTCRDSGKKRLCAGKGSRVTCRRSRCARELCGISTVQWRFCCSASTTRASVSCLTTPTLVDNRIVRGREACIPSPRALADGTSISVRSSRESTASASHATHPPHPSPCTFTCSEASYCRPLRLLAHARMANARAIPKHADASHGRPAFSSSTHCLFTCFHIPPIPSAIPPLSLHVTVIHPGRGGHRSRAR